ncbi:hypothetical protein Y1Q_0014568 [Alligator mississippiensis]|uniref:G-protein coupled receptors family 2 profile 1 domain-containing protein n=1 Tax=Alligator mississippiensis TaxID=8496 RepID=A0A151PE53_ALLMI|nr:hypothetical protein Y1Q_0014568 [Alligator mississippiensis]
MAIHWKPCFFVLTLLPLVVAVHSDCVFKKEQEACLEKIRRATVLNPMNDSSPGCAGMWDNITCWKPASVGEIVFVKCPAFFRIINFEDGWEVDNMAQTHTGEKQLCCLLFYISSPIAYLSPGCWNTRYNVTLKSQLDTSYYYKQ